MRSIVVTAALSLLSTGLWAQQAQQSTATGDFSCFENLPTPEYPAAALQQHVDGSVWTWVQVTPQGTPGKVDTQVVSAWSSGEKLLVPAVEKAVQAAKIKPDCAGKRLSVVFRYELHGQETANPKVTSRREAPDIVWIESQPAITNQTASRSSSH
ncbi:MAG TPA: energy transducer TonB [Bryobacteraceae bacterium]|nr:energy transducer TonB [Bryobacteraceae bacterium]